MKSPLLVIGLGNPLLGDDGLGSHAVQALARSGALPAGTRLLDGATGGLTLLPEIESAARVIVIDAVDLGLEPGEIRRMTGVELHMAAARSLTPHEIGLKDVLALCLLRGTIPEEIVLWGVQVETLAVGADLSASVDASLPWLVEAVVEEALRMAAATAA